MPRNARSAPLRPQLLDDRATEAPRAVTAAAPAHRVDVVVPVYNEQAALVSSIARLHAFLCDGFPYPWQIVIADNASDDHTPAIADHLASALPGVSAVHLERKGRGRALATVWSDSDAAVLAYMDVDLSTDLRALEPLVAGVFSGHAEVAIGTRLRGLGRQPRVRRGPRRELISRAYNHLLRVALHARFSDAQCGFKAVRADVARELLPEVSDTGWFFDTELLIAAQRRGMRIHEVAVDWVDDSDSRVDVLATALTDLRGVARLRLARVGRHHDLVARPSQPLTLAVLVAASLTATVCRYVALRTWVFGRTSRSASARMSVG